MPQSSPRSPLCRPGVLGSAGATVVLLLCLAWVVQEQETSRPASSAGSLPPGVVAQLGDRTFRAEELGLAGDSSPDARARHHLAIVVERELLAAAARRHHLDREPEVRAEIDAVLARHFASKVVLPELLLVEVSEAEFAAAANGIVPGALSPETLPELRRQLLLEQRLIRRNEILAALATEHGLRFAEGWAPASAARRQKPDAVARITRDGSEGVAR